MFYRGENQKIARSSAGSLRLPIDSIAFQPFHPLCFLSPLLLPGATAVQQIMESEVRRLTQELQAKDVELRELKEERSAMLLRYVREFTELQKRQASTTKNVEALVALLQKVGDTIGRQGSRLERERAYRDEVQDLLSHLVNQVATHVLRLRDAYRRASAIMPAVGLNPFDHPVDFNELRLPDLVSFFTYIS